MLQQSKECFKASQEKLKGELEKAEKEAHRYKEKMVDFTKWEKEAKVNEALRNSNIELKNDIKLLQDQFKHVDKIVQGNKEELKRMKISMEQKDNELKCLQHEVNK